MRTLSLIAAGLFLAAPTALAQPKKGEDFLKESPTIGDLLPDVTVYSPGGKEVKTSDLRGHYTVITFGCLT